MAVRVAEVGCKCRPGWCHAVTRCGHDADVCQMSWPVGGIRGPHQRVSKGCSKVPPCRVIVVVVLGTPTYAQGASIPRGDIPHLHKPRATAQWLKA